MSADAYFSLAALPMLDPPGSAPPLELARLLDLVPTGRPQALVRAVVLADDLVQREACLSGEIQDPTPVVLTVAQARGEEPLPEELTPDDTGAAARRVPADQVWEVYVRHVEILAHRLSSRFLHQWISYEVTLRNALVGIRAKALDREVGQYLVNRELQDSGGDVDAAVAAWTAAADPLRGLQALLSARWQWIEQHESWFSFEDDEFPAYAAKLVLLHRWHRSLREQSERWRETGAGGMHA